MAKRTRYNPERRTWRGRSHKRGGARTKAIKERPQLEWVGEKCGIRADEITPDWALPNEGYKLGDRDPCTMCDKPGCWATVQVKV